MEISVSFSFLDINSFQAPNFVHSDFGWITQNSKTGKGKVIINSYIQMKSLRGVGEWVHMPPRCSRASWASDLTWNWALRMICDILTYIPTSEWESKLLLFVFPCGPAVNCPQDVTLPPTEDS